MKLMTKEIEGMFKNAKYDNPDNPIVIVKYFSPVGGATWWCTEYNPVSRIFFGFVTGLAYDEWGYISLDELESVKVWGSLGIERDLWFKPVPIKQALKDYYGKEIL